MAEANKYFDEAGNRIFIQMKHGSHDAIAEQTSLEAFDEVWSKKGWTRFDPSEDDVLKAAIDELAVATPAKSAKAAK